MACPSSQIVAACDFPQFFVDQTPRFDELIMEDIRPTDGWLLNVSTGTTPMGTPTEVTQDRFRSVWPNTTRPWRRVTAASPGCSGHPCDPHEECIGWGADRLTYYAEEATWATPLLCYDQDMHVTHAEQHLAQVINEILRPATTAISSMFLRKRALLWAKYNHIADANLTPFTFVWSNDADGNEVYFDCTAAPAQVHLLVPQMLQNNFALSMLEGYAGKNPFKETAPFIELVTDMDTLWNLDKLGGSVGVGAGEINAASNWRFQEWSAANAYWRYGFSGQIGNYLARVDHMGLRFNYVTRLISGLYRYQLILPFVNNVTTGAGAAAGIGSDPNPDFQKTRYAISFQWHKKAMELLVPDARPINPEMPYGHRDFGGKWKFLMNNLGEDQAGNVIVNKWENKGQFGAWFKYYVRPLHTEFARVYFHERSQFCIPELHSCADDPGYPAQSYVSCLPDCESVEAGPFGTGVPTGSDAGPLEDTAAKHARAD